ncbi:MAG TPA: hypothetical protein PLX14_07625 [Anaerolineales bacterium]|nr:hypothetical protein [Anaerolineales bacterium]
MRNHWLRITGGILGMALIILMIFPNQLGLESFPTWGIRRTTLLLAGILLAAISLLYRKDNIIGRLTHSRDAQFYISLLALNTAILLIYTWFASAGLWKTLPNETNYYDLQANAFAKGQLALDVEPDPAFLAMPAEILYEPENRTGIPVLWDATLYEGKYYLYWGPSPALLFTPLKFVYSQDLGDKLLALIFLAGTLSFLNLIILSLWRRHFSHIPRWAVLAAVAFAGLVNPMPYIMVEGRIYEAAIIAAQFFLVGGFYFLLPALDKPAPLPLALAGLFFALAIGARTPLAPGVGLVSLLLCIWAFQTQRQRMIPLLASFAIPLVISAAGYMAYNQARFDSVTEFGFRYQLTSYNLYKNLDQTLSVAYFPPNIYKTVLNPLERREAFPYVFPNRWAGPEWLTNYQPGMYLTFTENITGILISSPFLLLGLLSIFRAKANIRWILFALSLAALGIFLTLLTYFFIAMRYLLDLIPTLTILAIIGFWHGFDLFKNKKAYIFIALILLAYTLSLSLLISYSGNLELFKIHNPELVKQLTWTFNTLIR